VNESKPEFHLRRLDSDGQAGPPEVFPVYALPGDTQLSRRGLLGAGVTVAGVLACLRAAPAAAQVKSTVAIRAHVGGVRALAFTPDGKLLFSGSADKTVKSWTVPEGMFQRSLVHHTDAVEALAVSKDGKLLASGGADRTVRFWSLPMGTLAQTAEQGGGIAALAASSGLGTVLASGGPNKSVRLWSFLEKRLLRTLDGHAEAVRSVAVSWDGKLVASGAADKTARLWGVPEGQLVKALAGHADAVNAVAFCGDIFLATGSADKTVRLWKVPQGNAVATLEGHRGAVHALAATPNGRTLASASADGTVKLWSLPGGTLERTLQGHAGAVLALAVSADGKTLASGDAEGVIILWDLASGKVKGHLFDPKVTEADVYVYTVKDEKTGRTVTYTLPCGAPVPANATCVCNCVPAKSGLTTPKVEPFPFYFPEPAEPAFPGGFMPGPFFPGGGYGGGGYGGGGGTICTCNKICTCIPVCQAHRLLHPDPVVRVMAEELLLVMGDAEFGYMSWAAGRAGPELRARIGEVMNSIRAGAGPRPERLPGVRECARYLDDPDEVVAIMAAQTIAAHGPGGAGLDGGAQGKVDRLLASAAETPWHVRYGIRL
jgi:hypothetical protein